MPVVAAANAFAALATTTLATKVLVYGSILVGSFIIGRALVPSIPKLNSSAQDPKRVRSSFNAERTPARWVVGRARVGGWIYSMEEGLDGYFKITADISDPGFGYRALSVSIAVSESGFDAIEKVYINGAEVVMDRVASVNASGVYTLYGSGDTIPSIAPMVPSQDQERRIITQGGSFTSSSFTFKRIPGTLPLNDPDTILDVTITQGSTTEEINNISLAALYAEEASEGDMVTNDNSLRYTRGSWGIGITTDGSNGILIGVTDVGTYTVDIIAENRRSLYYVDLQDADNVAEYANLWVEPLGTERGDKVITRSDVAGNTPNTTDRRAQNVGIVWQYLFQPLEDLPGRDVHPSTATEELVWQSVPSFEYLCKGIRIRWPQDNAGTLQTDPAWTDNAAAILYWFLTDRCGVTPDVIDNASFRAAYTRCASSVVIGDTSINRGTCDGVIDSTDSTDPWPTIKEILFCFNGELVEVDGKIRIMAGVARAVTRFLTDADIISTDEILIAPPYRDRINAAVMGLVQSSENDYTTYELPEFIDTDAMERDGSKLSVDLGTRAFVRDPRRAQQLVAVELKKARARATYTYTLAPGATFDKLTWAPGDIVGVTDSETGLSNMRMKILQTTLNADFSVTVVLQESPVGIYDDTTVVLPPLDTSPPPPPARDDRPAAPSGFTAVGSIDVEGGRIVSRIRCAVDDYRVATVFHIVGPNGYEERVIAFGEYTFEVPEEGTYEIKARTIVGRFESSGVDRSVTISYASLNPPTPVLGTVTSNITFNNARTNAEVRLVVNWTSTNFDTIVKLVGKSTPVGTDNADVNEEQLIPSDQSSATFLVPGLGDLTLTLQHQLTAIDRQGTILSSDRTVGIGTHTPTTIVPTTSIDTNIADDGTIVSDIIFNWASQPDRTRVQVEGPEMYDRTRETLEPPLRFSVYRQGTYTYSAEHYNAHAEGTEVTGSVSVDWSGITPTQRLRGSANSNGRIVNITLEEARQRHITQAEFRYTFRPEGDTTSPSAITTETEWNAAAVLGRFPYSTHITTSVETNGTYRVYGRAVNSAGLLGPISEIGTVFIFIVIEGGGSVEFGTNWDGVFDFMDILSNSGPAGDIIVYNPGDVYTLTKGQFSNVEGWPFGKEKTWSMTFPRANNRDIRTTKDQERIRWTVGTNNQAEGSAWPHQWVDGDADIYLGTFSLERTGEGFQVGITLKKGTGTGTEVTEENEVLMGLEQRGTFTLTYGSTTINIASPDYSDNVASDDTEPFLWIPPTGVQSQLNALLNGLVDGSITDDVVLKLRESPSFQSPVVDLGELRTWSVAMFATILQPTNPQAPTITPVSTYTITLEYGPTTALGNVRTISPASFIQIQNLRHIRVRVNLSEAWVGSAFSSLRLQWGRE